MPFLFGQVGDMKARLVALDRSQAVITFTPEGLILTANQNFLDAMGYTLSEIQGKHHSLFVEPEQQGTSEYKRFWQSLKGGEFQAGEFARIGKGGKEVWLQASYNPLLDARGKTFKVVKYATDITARKLQVADYEGQIAAIGKSQAVIHFNLDSSIIMANENFLTAMGYSLSEIKGKSHRLFVDEQNGSSAEYSAFWDALRRGEFQAGEFLRRGKGGKEVWIQASYNPIRDMKGRPFKVVKYATDITSQVQKRQRNEHALKMMEESLAIIARSISDANIQAGNAAAASGQMSSNVQAVATAVEEMNASISEISSNMARTRVAVDEVTQDASLANESTSRLAEMAQAMTKIVDLIKNIAGQISLLALNATIESARAGDAGKGFAVVASEVKTLAMETAKATDQIASEIEGLQSVSKEVVRSLTRIGASVSNVQQYVTGAAGAIEEQTAVTREISQNMNVAATGVSSIGGSLQVIAAGAQSADQSTQELQSAIRSLAS